MDGEKKVVMTPAERVKAWRERNREKHLERQRKYNQAFIARRVEAGLREAPKRRNRKDPKAGYTHESPGEKKDANYMREWEEHCANSKTTPMTLAEFDEYLTQKTGKPPMTREEITKLREEQERQDKIDRDRKYPSFESMMANAPRCLSEEERRKCPWLRRPGD